MMLFYHFHVYLKLTETKAQEVESKIWRGSTDWTNFSKRAVGRGDTKKHGKNSKILNLTKQTVKNI